MTQMNNVIHVISATAIVAGDGEHHYLAMCGEDLGPHKAASERHPSGNYITQASKSFARVTCQSCRDRMTETWDRWYQRGQSVRDSGAAREQAGPATPHDAGEDDAEVLWLPKNGERVAVRPLGWDPGNREMKRCPDRDYEGTVVGQGITGAYSIVDDDGTEHTHMSGDLQPLDQQPLDQLGKAAHDAAEEAIERERVEQVTAGEIAAAPAEGPVPVMYGEEAERQLRIADRCTFQTGYGLPHEEYCGSPNNPEYGATNLEGLCTRHGRGTAGIEDPDIEVGDRVRETDPNRYGTVTVADNNGYRVRWDGQDVEYDADYGQIEPVDDDRPDAREDGLEPGVGPGGQVISRLPGHRAGVGTVENVEGATAQVSWPDGHRDEAFPTGQLLTMPTAHDAGPAPSAETTGLGSALAYTAQMAACTAGGAASVETSLASLADGQVSGPVLQHLSNAQEALAAAQAEFAAAHAELQHHVGVQEAYAATPDAGSRQFVTGD